MRSTDITGHRPLRSRVFRATTGLLVACAVGGGLLVTTAGTAGAIATAVPLATAANFAVLAGSGITKGARVNTLGLSVSFG